MSIFAAEQKQETMEKQAEVYFLKSKLRELKRKRRPEHVRAPAASSGFQLEGSGWILPSERFGHLFDEAEIDLQTIEEQIQNETERLKLLSHDSTELLCKKDEMKDSIRFLLSRKSKLENDIQVVIFKFETIGLPLNRLLKKRIVISKRVTNSYKSKPLE